MKVTRECPKCMGRKLWHIEGIETGPYSSTGGQVLKLAARRRTPPVRESNWLTGDGSELYDAGQVDAFVCAGCGYTEFWSHDFEKLTHNPASGVHFIDG